MRELTWSEIVWLAGEHVGVELVFVAILQVWDDGTIDVRMRGRHPLRRRLVGVETEIRRTAMTTTAWRGIEARVVAAATEVWQPSVRLIRTTLRGSSPAYIADPSDVVQGSIPDEHDVDVAARAAELRARVARLERAHPDVCAGLRQDIERAMLPFWVLAVLRRPRSKTPDTPRRSRERERDWLRGWKRLNPRPPSASD